jgi:hypothetical protein
LFSCRPRRWKVFALCLLAALTGLAAAPPPGCPAGAPIADVDLRVRSSRGTGDAIPLRTINRLEEGDLVDYKPIVTKITRERGAVALVLVRARRQPDEDPLVVLEPKDAVKPEQWTVPAKTSIALFVYGPAGLSRAKVKRFLLKDDSLVGELADYAEKTAQTEGLLAALMAADTQGASVDAAVNGFASQYGLNVKFDPHAATDQQAMTLFSTLNPAVGSLDPLSLQTSQRIGTATSLATSVATLFIGSPVGLIAGGAAMAMQMKALAFPKAEFRSSFAESLPPDGMALCGSRAPVPPHTQVAFLWATRIPNSPAPQLHIGDVNTVPPGQKARISVDANETDWKLVDRARNWQLISKDGKSRYPVAVSKPPLGGGLELDLTGVTKIEPDDYILAANWDWDQFTVHGIVGVRPLGDLAHAHLTAVSQDQLIARAGRLAVTLEGTDFEFVDRVQFQKINDRFGAAEPVPFVLPQGSRRGLQGRLDVQLNTIDLDPGDYRLTIAQAGGSDGSLDVKVLPVPPKILSLPILVNVGDNAKEVTLSGERLDQVTRIEVEKGKIDLGSGDSFTRKATVHLQPGLPPGSRQDVKLWVKDRALPIVLLDAVRVVGPRPRITESKLSAPEGMDITLHPGELPSGYFLSTMLRVKNLDPASVLKLSCASVNEPEATVRVGEQTPQASLQQLSDDQLFLSFDSSVWPSGCVVTARVSNGNDGLSDAFQIGRILRVPKIESFKLSSEPAGEGFYMGLLIGQNLETVEKTGWDAQHPNPVLGFPTPLPGEGQKQSLKVKMPWPSPMPHAPLFIWLRGARQALATTIHE